MPSAYYVVYVLENQLDKTWYTGFTEDLKERLRAHQSGQSHYTKGKDWNLIYAELYRNKQDALGREKFLKSGSGKQFIRKQLKHYLGSQ